MLEKFIWFYIPCLIFYGVNGLDGSNGSQPLSSETQRPAKYFSLFSVVRFSNDFCYGNNGFNGTCLTSLECTETGGTAAGACASGFGVCCYIAITTCGSTVTRNTTYWQNSGYPTASTREGHCTLYVKKINSGICQLRLDFVAFSIAGPSSATTATSTQCLTDLFTVTGSSNLVPTICGSNAGQHIYAHMSPSTDTFILNFVTTGTSTSRTWNILINQIPCSTSYTAPRSCLQWFTSASGSFSSFNYLFSTTPIQHLANQDYTICIRTNDGFCGISYSVCPSSVPAASQFGLSAEYGTATVIDFVCLSDFIQIPCANDQQNANQLLSQSYGCTSKICGNVFSAFVFTTSPQTVYSYRQPFEVRVFTDNTEGASFFGGLGDSGIGFCLQYNQQPCTTTSG